MDKYSHLWLNASLRKALPPAWRDRITIEYDDAKNEFVASFSMPNLLDVNAYEIMSTYIISRETIESAVDADSLPSVIQHMLKNLARNMRIKQSGPHELVRAA